MAVFANTPNFKSQFLSAFDEVLSRKQPGDEFSADDVWAVLALKGVENRSASPAIPGSIFNTARRSGLIENTERSHLSQRGPAKGRRVSVWRVKA